MFKDIICFNWFFKSSYFCYNSIMETKKENIELIIPYHGKIFIGKNKEKIINKISNESRLSALLINKDRIQERSIDSFIYEEIRRTNIQGNLVNEPLFPVVSSRDSFSSSEGLRASVQSGDRESLTVNGEAVILPGGRYTRVDFTPEGRVRMSRAKTTDSLARGIRGIAEMLEAIDRGRFESAPIFIGATNINMALIAQRLGFAIVDQSRTADGVIDTKQSSFIVVGRLEDIREQVEYFKESGRVGKLLERDRKSKRRLVPQPA